MRRPTAHQLAVYNASLGLTLAETGRRFSIGDQRVRQIRASVRKFLEWHHIAMEEQQLPLSDRQIRFMPLARRTRFALINHGISTGQQLAQLDRRIVTSLPGMGLAAWRDIEAYLVGRIRVEPIEMLFVPSAEIGSSEPRASHSPSTRSLSDHAGNSKDRDKRGHGGGIRGWLRAAFSR